ncbi:MAG: GNAT family N-acetyltransferase [Armatimonadetes bacterium]|nr:GNAT family N-acetyltransferase [Armatimonadota bacterium]
MWRPIPVLIPLPDELLGPRVLVRPYCPGDGAALWEAIEESRQHLQPWLPWEKNHRAPPDSEAYVRRAHREWVLREDLHAGIWERESGRLLGGSGLHPRGWRRCGFEIGYWIRKSAEGHGYVREAVSLLTRFAFERLEARRVEIRCHSRNERSARVAKRLGFTLEGCLRNAGIDNDGQPHDILVFALIPEDYQRCRDHWPPGEARQVTDTA